MDKKLKKELTWADLKKFVNKLPADVMNHKLRWWGEERGGTVKALTTLDEPYILTDEGWEAEQAFDKSEIDAYIESSSEEPLPKGAPLIHVD